MINIQVYDEQRKIKRDFKCDSFQLINQMKYFNSYFLNHTDKEIDISVHCDIQVFEWLLLYIKAYYSNNNIKYPDINIGNCISILVSSEFLCMEILLNQTIQYVCTYLQDIIYTRIDLNCLSNEIIKKISKLYKIQDLDHLIDIKDKIVSKIYIQKIKNLFIDNQETSIAATTTTITTATTTTNNNSEKNHNSLLSYCPYCETFYFKKYWDVLYCSFHSIKYPKKIGFNGELEGPFHLNVHEIEKEKEIKINIDKIFIQYIEEKIHKYEKDYLEFIKKCYWWIWSLLQILYCKICCKYFSCNHFNKCFHHLYENTNSYTCSLCNNSSFDLFISSGCKESNHIVDNKTETYKIVLEKSLMIENKDIMISFLEYFKKTKCYFDFFSNYILSNKEELTNNQLHSNDIYPLLIPSIEIHKSQNSYFKLNSNDIEQQQLYYTNVLLNNSLPSKKKIKAIQQQVQQEMDRKRMQILKELMKK